MCDATATDHAPRGGQRAVNLQTLFTMHQLDPVHTSFWIFHPEAGISQYNGHCGKRLHIFFVDVLQLLRIGGLLSKAYTERVQDTVVLGIGLINLWKLPVFDIVIIHD